MNSYIEPSYNILCKVFKEKTYSARALSGENSLNDAATRIVYGVLDKNIELEYIINSLCAKKPRESVKIILKIGAYCLLYMDNLPDYAIVNETVEFVKSLGKGGAAGFVNAVLMRVARREYKVLKPQDTGYLSVKYSKPDWFIKRLFKEYGEAARAILDEPQPDEEHIRINGAKTTLEAVKKTLAAQSIAFEQSAVGGLAVRNTDEVKAMFKCGLITYQSPSSMLAVQALAPRDGAKILDLCAAPGGKSVYIAELCPNSTVYACDLHKHRVELITAYKKRMGITNIKEMQHDALKFNAEFEGKFDFVLIDAPCSSLGTFRKHPDVFLRHDEKSIVELAALQQKILQNARRYVAKGGVLLYSTCTLFDAENKGVIKRFLESDAQFVLEKMPIPYDNDGMYAIMPKEHWDGFFMTRLKNAEKL